MGGPMTGGGVAPAADGVAGETNRVPATPPPCKHADLVTGIRKVIEYCQAREVYQGRDRDIGADTAYGDVADQLRDLIS